MVTDNEVLLIEPTHANLMKNQISEIDADGGINALAGDAQPFDVVSFDNGANIAVIPVHGYLAHRSAFHFPGYYTGYNFIQESIKMADADPSVDGIALDVNSGGGMVHGAFETAEVIRETGKPVLAIVDASAYSAGYLLSSAADKVVLSKTGGAGSIGVVTMHMDVSKALGERGVKITMLYAGEYKVDGNPFEELSPEAKQRIESRLEKSYDLFARTVADYRGVSVADVKNTKAGIYHGDDAAEVGLVDAVMPPAEAYTAFANELSKNTDGGIIMAEKQTQASAPQVEEARVDASALKQEGVTSERQRISAILGCDEAEGRSELANHLAFETEMDADAAKSILAASAKEDTKVESATQQSPFDAAMSQGNPEIEAESADDAQQMDASQQILHDLKQATGI